MPLDTAWVALCIQPRIGGKTLRALLRHFGSAEAVLAAEGAALREVPGVGQTIAQGIQAIDRAQVQAQLVQWEAQGVRLLPWDATGYPAALHDLDDEPPLLFLRGAHVPADWARMVAIVGTRRADGDMRGLAQRLGAELAQRGWWVVSGMALGIDEAAHWGALSAAEGRTVAVLGSGVLNVYPHNPSLEARIVQQGLLLGENAPDATVNAARLVARNRLISALAQHIIVVQTDVDGGAMYAARAAQRLGRKLYALGVPTSGNLQLLKEGAGYIAPDLRELPL